MRVLALVFLLLLGAAAPASAPYAVVKPGVALRFPADHGAHPEFRTEWWYVTGWLKTEKGEDLGFQVTFFRTRPPIDTANPSAFAPRQILFAHAAISDPATGKLLHAQRIARQGFGLAEAATGDMKIVLDEWRMARRADGRIATRVQGRSFALDLTLAPTQPVLLQGQAGYSRKGPSPAEASHYYSRHAGARRQARGRDRHGLDGPGMVLHAAQPGGRGLGLAGAEPGRWRRVDAVSGAQCQGWSGVGRRLAAPR
jgi:predicted secreted hydrolase